jgi:iron complex outermembrane recepter protein
MLKSMTIRSTLAALAFAVSFSAHAVADQPRQFNIPAGDLVPALEVLEKQAVIELVFQPEQLKSFHTKGVTGRHEPKDAVRILLEGTALELRADPTGAMVIVPQGAKVSASTLGTAEGTSAGGNNDSSGDWLRLAQTTSATSSSSTSLGAQTSRTQKPGELEEVIVTAQKREERPQDVPVPVTAIDAESLIDSNQLRLQDYYGTIPGFTVTSVGSQSIQLLSIRGINTGIEGNPSVGITVDDVPYGSSTTTGGSGLVPDLDPADLARVEVLRGPQGTLYGASSVGGLVKFVTLDPSTAAVSGRIQADVDGVSNGADVGYGVRGAVNVPLSDTLAIRASGFTREDPGYIDNVLTGEKGVNRTEAEGAHVAVLWKPSEAFSLKVSALTQQNRTDGSSDAAYPSAAAETEASQGVLQQNYIPGVGGYFRRFEAFSAILNANLAGIDITAITGYNINGFHDSFDYSYGVLALTESTFGVSGTGLFTDNTTDKFSQELRLSSSVGPFFDWMLGAFYTRESSQYAVRYLAENVPTGQIVGEGYYVSFPSTYKETAGFADLTVHLSDRFDVQIGGRESEIRQTLMQTQIGPYVLPFNGVPSPDINPQVNISNSAFTYLLTPRFKVSQDLMLYARLASGYRAGGVNIGGGVPPQYDPDKTKDYEIGAKGNVIDHMLSFDTSLYYIDWQNIQITGYTSTGFSYVANAARAKSEGVELSVEFTPVPDLKMSAWVAYGLADLTAGFPQNSATYGGAGDRLPYSSRISDNLSVEKDFMLSNSVTGFVGGAVSYIGERQGEFTSGPPLPPPRQEYPAYARTDLRTGVKFDSWTINVFANNVTDRRGLIGGGLGSYPPFAFTFIQPRTIGLSAVKTF